MTGYCIVVVYNVSEQLNPGIRIFVILKQGNSPDNTFRIRVN